MIMVTGTVRSAVKQQAQINQWQQKKESGNVLSKKELNQRENWGQADWMKHNYEQQLLDQRESARSQELANKVANGQTLTPDEISELKEKNPDLYRRYQENLKAEERFKEKLERCKTKDEVEEVKFQSVSECFSKMKSVEHNTCIGISEKLATAQEVLGKLRLIGEAEAKFKQSLAYQSLPTEAEIEEAEAQERKAEQEELLEEGCEAAEDMLEERAEDATDDMSDNNTDNITDGRSAEKIEEISTEVVETAEDVEEVIEDISLKAEPKRKTAPKKDIEDMVREVEAGYKRIKFNVDIEHIDSKPREHVKRKGQKVNISV